MAEVSSLLPCPSCGSRKVIVEDREDVILYGRSGPGQVRLTCKIPVHECLGCTTMFVDHVGEDIRDATIKAYLLSRPR